MQIFFEQENEYPDYFAEFNNITCIVCKAFNLPENLELELNFVNSDEIREINKSARSVDKPTDVLSFPNLNIECGKIDIKKFKLDINPETENLMLGEIVICYDVAKNQADEYGHSLKRELCYLFVHGLLHLLSFDHIKDDDKKIMRKAEEQILSEINLTRGIKNE